MSRVGKRPVTIPSGVTATVDGQTVKMKGPKGQLQFIVHDDVEVKFENGAVTVTSSCDESGVILQVSDDGPGIPADDLPHVFERFYRADKSRTGSQGRYGLGLAICRGLVEAEGGTITVEIEPGQGACFTVRLPTAHYGANPRS